LHSALQDPEFKSGPNPGWDERWQFECSVRVCYDFLFYRGALPPDLPELQEIRSLGSNIFGEPVSELTEAEVILHMAYPEMMADMIFPDDHKIWIYAIPQYWSKWYPHMTRLPRTGKPATEEKSSGTSSALKPKWDSESRTLHLGERSWLLLKRGNAKN